MFFNLGGQEFFLLGLVALLLFGPRRLPELARAFGEAVANFREASRQVSHEFRRQLEEETSPPSPPPPSIPGEVLLPPAARPMGSVAEVPDESDLAEAEHAPESTDHATEEKQSEQG